MKSPMLIFISTLTGYCHIQDVRPCLPQKEDELSAIAAHIPQDAASVSHLRIVNIKTRCFANQDLPNHH